MKTPPMHASLRPRDLGPIAMRYLRKQLGSGCELARRHLGSLDVPTAHVWGWLPEGGVELPENYDFGGVLTPKGVTEAREALVRFIQDYLRGGNKRVLMVEDQVHRRTDPAPRTQDFFRRHAAIFTEKCAYLFVTAEDLDLGTSVAETLTMGDNYPLNAFLTAGLSSVPPPDALPRLLTEISAKTQHIVVSAFDGEGYVVWSKDSE